MKATVRTLYREMIPSGIRESGLVQRVKTRFFKHDWIYDRAYYEGEVESQARGSAEVMAPDIIAEFEPLRVMDVGCGAGAMMAALKASGCRVRGLDYSAAGVRKCLEKGLDVSRFDLENDSYTGEVDFDLVISMEVAEHLPERKASGYVKLLTSLAPVVVFTAAPPGQGGTDHVNEQPQAWWVQRFKEYGFQHDAALSSEWSSRWAAAGSVAPWYHENIMVFRSAVALQS